MFKKILSIVLALCSICIEPMLAQNATVMEHSTEVEYTSGKTVVFRHKRVVVIYNTKGAKEADFVAFCNPYQQLSKFAGSVTDLRGKTLLKVKKADLTRSEYSSSLADDSYFFFYDYSPANIPVIVRYEWEEVCSKHILSYPMLAPQSTYDVNVKKASYRFIAPASIPLRWHSVNCQPELSHREERGRSIYEFTLTDLPAIERYAYGLPFREQVPLVYFAPDGFDIAQTHCDLSSWQTMGIWTWQLLQGRDQLPEELKTKIHQLTDTCRSEKSKVMVLRRYMGETTRYVSIQLGIGGWQPMTAAEVYSKGVGDCKALSNYLRAMLEEVGISSVYTLMATDHRSLLPDFPTMNQLDHVVLMVPIESDTLWIECTNPHIPTGYAPAGWAGHECVMITPNGGQTVRVPVLPLEHHKEIATYTIRLDGKGNAHLDARTIGTGRCYESDAAIQYQSDKERKNTIIHSLELPKPTISRLDIASEGAALMLNLEAESDGYARMSGSRMFIPLSPYRFEALRNSKEPAHIVDMRDKGYLHSDTIRLLLPEGWEVENIPTEKNDSCEFGINRLSIEATEQQVEVVITSLLNNGLYPAEKYDEWVAFHTARSALTKGDIVLKAKKSS